MCSIILISFISQVQKIVFKRTPIILLIFLQYPFMYSFLYITYYLASCKVLIFEQFLKYFELPISNLAIVKLINFILMFAF